MRWEPTIRSTHPEEDDDPSSYVLSGGGGGEAYSAGNGGAGGAAGGSCPPRGLRRRGSPSRVTGPLPDPVGIQNTAPRTRYGNISIRPIPDEVVRLRPRAEMPTVSHPEAAKRAISLGCDEGPRERELVSMLLACLHPDPLTDGETEAGFGMVLDAIEELTIDIPDAKVRRLFCFLFSSAVPVGRRRAYARRRLVELAGQEVLLFFFFASFVWSLSLRNRSGRGGAGGRTQIVRGSRVERGRKSRDEKEKDGEGG